MSKSQLSWVRSEHPPTLWNLGGARWSSVECWLKYYWINKIKSRFCVFVSPACRSSRTGGLWRLWGSWGRTCWWCGSRTAPWLPSPPPADTSSSTTLSSTPRSDMWNLFRIRIRSGRFPLAGSGSLTFRIKNFATSSLSVQFHFRF